MTIDDLGQKVENGGVTATGRLTAEEWNVLVAFVKGLRTISGIGNVDASADGIASEDMVMFKKGGETYWFAKPAHQFRTPVDVLPSENSENAISSDFAYRLSETISKLVDRTRKISQTETFISIYPNVLNVWGAVSGLTIAFQDGEAGRVNEYMMQFTVSSEDFDLILPSQVRWAEEPTWEMGRTYQVSIEDNLALYAEWEAARQ